MKKKIISIAMGFILACSPMSYIQASEYLEEPELSQTVGNKFYIEPDRQSIELKIDSKYAFINQKQYQLNSAPTIIKDKLYVPFKFIADEMLDIHGQFDIKTRRITLKQYNKTIVLTEGKQTATINGQTVKLEAAPIIQKGALLLPFKFISEQFNILFELDNVTSTVKFSLIEDISQKVEGNRPVAKFAFEKNTFVAGQAIKILDQSFDQDGDAIIERQWQIDHDKANRSSSLEAFLEKPAPGEHYISLRVKDSKNNWSEWFTQSISIQPNIAPIISKLQLPKESFAQGEEIDIEYTYENEAWEPIEEELWSYSIIDKKSNQKDSTIGKPRALFYPGEYSIELQLKDAYGNMSEKIEKVITITDKIIQTELDYKFKKGIIGSVIDNYAQFNYQNYSVVDDYTVTNTGAKLLMSNSPESVNQKGILYKDKVQGAGRVLYHHKNIMNDSFENKRLVIMMENKNETPITVTKRREGTRGPTNDILHAGSLALADFLNKDFYHEYTLLAGEKKYLFDTVKRQWNSGDTVSGMIEFYSNEEVHITIAVIGQDTQIADIDALPILAKDGIHTRGSFENADRYYNLMINNDKPYKIMLGLPANNMEDWLEGYDALTGEKVINKGNYGMLYWLRLRVKEETGVLFNVRSNIYKGAIAYTDKGAYAMPQNGFVKGPKQAFVAGIVKENKMSELIYALPNGSAAPVLFCFIPKSQWNK
ncbi:copper amine oxidase N-terminal domain-containing protein [Cellulosilyticum sp. I15G10I2]|uniref:copper amine oxidase N-terminal domain-containing protein n=1 Tax=Cellulosilyticum sp. I15G10I2 TaxID=1892843 RepID=UPI00085CC937|nr:copper amine oxidase N-terminal domain-containing protein [Cellulosilyticum sp. I15G10I2]